MFILYHLVGTLIFIIFFPVFYLLKNRDRFKERLGMNLPDLKKTITQENINLYAEASQDFNPIHIDEGFAKQTPLGGTIAHGMLILAYASQMMTATFGRRWLIGGKLNIRFKDPARPGDAIVVSGKISKLEKKDGQTTTCSVICKNQKGELIIVGEAQLGGSSDENSH